MAEKPELRQFETVRTTVTLPVELVERTQGFVERGILPNRSAAITAALEYFLDEVERQEIDRAFGALADDAAYRAMSEEVAESFATSDWEAFIAAEADDA
jgi:Arc/MetJ-type ribon-helix-helix transcriptional regulator